jgi:hypothetical protein
VALSGLPVPPDQVDGTGYHEEQPDAAVKPPVALLKVAYPFQQLLQGLVG